jgi:histidinol-phosphate aminotransferase
VTYSFYPVYCDYYGIEYDKVPLDESFAIDIRAFISRKGSCGIIFANPNAPTGTCLPRGQILRLLEDYPRENVVVIDEAYIDFGGESALSLQKEFRNVLVVRTFSKSMCLAGLRLGFVIGHKDLIQALFAAKDAFNSYPVDVLAQLIGEVALSDDGYYRSITDTIIATREDFSQRLLSMRWKVLPSKANFVFAAKQGASGKEIYQKLKERGILVRHFDDPLIRDFIRITIGKKEDMEALLGALKDIL